MTDVTRRTVFALSGAAATTLGLAACTAAGGSGDGFGASATAAPSPGHSSTSNGPSGVVSIRAGIAFTPPARSNTTRTMPGSGWPVRTDFTAPRPAGKARPRPS